MPRSKRNVYHHTIASKLCVKTIADFVTLCSVVGRRKENLEEFVHEHGREKCSAVPFDVCELEKIPNFVIKYVEFLFFFWAVVFGLACGSEGTEMSGVFRGTEDLIQAFPCNGA